MKRLIYIIAIFISVNLFAQQQEGKKHVQKLASPEMYGRGYVNNGIQIAEKYIISCFKNYGIQPFDYFDGYTQDVTYTVNTFPDQLSLYIDNVELTPGKDFLIDAISAGGIGSLKCIPFSNNDLQSICNDSNIKELKEKYKTKYAKICLIFDETDSTLTKKQKDKINDWISIDLVWSGLYSIGAIVKLTNEKLTQNIAGVSGNTPYFIVSKQAIKNKPKTINFAVTQKLDTITAKNIYGYVPGKDSTKKAIVFTAHYDHIGMTGQKTIFPGANDNASGMAMLLTLAKHYSENQPEQDIIFVALCGEELGMKGSKESVADFPIELEDIAFLVNIDLVGTGEDGICVVNGKIFSKEFEILQKINEKQSFFKNIQVRGEACNSDHCPFYKKGVPSFYIYTKGGTTAYHDIYDSAEQLPLTKFNEYFNLVTEFIKALEN
ncbi:MAG: M28 family peptidase [Bacteroidales bacterium]|nr:M28 family peptidase [Bacteroidales bacterium]